MHSEPEDMSRGWDCLCVYLGGAGKEDLEGTGNVCVGGWEGAPNSRGLLNKGWNPSSGVLASLLMVWDHQGRCTR